MSHDQLHSVVGEGARLGKGVGEVVAEDGEPGGRACRAVKGTSHMALGLLHAGGWAAPKAAHLGSVKTSQPVLWNIAKNFRFLLYSHMNFRRDYGLEHTTHE